MRCFVLGVVGLLASSALSQDSPAASAMPDAIVQVQVDTVGANLVRISMSDANYPVDQLQTIVKKLGDNTANGARGIQVSDDPIDPAKPQTSRLLKAVFAVDGLVSKTDGSVRVGPIAKAFAGAASGHQIQNVQIDFDYLRPTDTDLGNYNSASVDVTRRTVSQSLEYLVHLKSQDPSQINIPEGVPVTKAGAATPSNSPIDWVVVGTLAVAAIAIMALVYSLFLLSPKFRTKSRG